MITKKLVSIIAIALMMLSLVAFMPMSKAVTVNDVTQTNADKIAPNLQTAVDANPNGDNRIIVVLKIGVDQAFAVNIITNLGGTINAQFSIINGIAATLPADKILPLTALVSVDKILVDGIKTLPPDPLGDDSGSQPVSGPDPNALYAQFPFTVGADKCWNIGIDGTGVVVAVLDTGINWAHPDLAGVVVNPATDYAIFTGETDQLPFHDYGLHGTACSGLVASQGIQTYYGIVKVMGVAPGAKLIGGKVLTSAGWGWDSWIINGIQWAVAKGANIITMSLGGLEVPNNGYDPTCLALEAATAAGVTCFVAAGNTQGAGTVSSAGDGKSIITVGASTDGGDLWNIGPNYFPYYPAQVTGYENNQVIFWSGGGATADGRLDPDVCAPGAWGTTLYATSYVSLYTQFGGTRMATPVAAGVGALVYQKYRQYYGVWPSPATVKDILMNTAKDLGYPANRQGAGRVDAYQAVLAARGAYAPYSNTDYISKMIPAGSGSAPVWTTFTSTVGTAQAVWLQSMGTVTVATGTSVPRGSQTGNGVGDTYLYFTIPQGVDYADVRLKFPPELIYGTPIHSYTGATWKDTHINTVLYKERTEGDPNDLIMINYAYAHTNVQWFDARIDFGPGTYVIRCYNTGGLAQTLSPVDVQVNLYHFVPWTWVSTVKLGTQLLTNVVVPWGTTPGSYSGFVKATVSGTPIDIPIVITVPATLGQTFTVKANVMLEPRTSASGDWYYIPVQAFTVGPTVVTFSWTQQDADFDVYLVNPAGEVRASSYAPSASAHASYSGGGGRQWYTTTGTTMEMLSTFNLFPGYWYIGIHAIYFGNTYSQTVTVKMAISKPINTPYFVPLTHMTLSNTFTVSNNIPGGVHVDTMAMQLATEPYTSSGSATVYSYDGTAPHQGYLIFDIPVTPDMINMKVTINWAGGHSLSMGIGDPFGRMVGWANTNGGSVTVNNPAIGWWGAIITINDVGNQAFTVTVSGTHFKLYSDVTITPSSFTLTAMGTQAVTVTDTPSTPAGPGVIVFYDFNTGSTYSRTLLSISH